MTPPAEQDQGSTTPPREAGAQRILVTGASGFIGRHVVAALTGAGVAVHAAGRTDPRVAGVAFHAVDLLGPPAAVRAAVGAAGASHLLHLAWDLQGGRLDAPSHLDWIGPSIGLLRAFAEAGGGRAVVAGSSLEYGPVAETLDDCATPCRPATLYGAAKDAARRACAAYARTAGISLAWARVFSTYGPGDRSGRLVPAAIDSLLAGRRFAATSGDQTLDLSHVSDVSAALVALAGGAVEGPVDVGSGQAVTVRTVLDTLERLTGAGPLVAFGARSDGAGHLNAGRARIDRLVQATGFVPAIGLEDGLADTVAFHRRARPDRARRTAGSGAWA